MAASVVPAALKSLQDLTDAWHGCSESDCPQSMLVCYRPLAALFQRLLSRWLALPAFALFPLQVLSGPPGARALLQNASTQPLIACSRTSASLATALCLSLKPSLPVAVRVVALPQQHRSAQARARAAAPAGRSARPTFTTVRRPLDAGRAGLDAGHRDRRPRLAGVRRALPLPRPDGHRQRQGRPRTRLRHRRDGPALRCSFKCVVRCSHGGRQRGSTAARRASAQLRLNDRADAGMEATRRFI